jgi:hypothetical protein
LRLAFSLTQRSILRLDNLRLQRIASLMKLMEGNSKKKSEIFKKLMCSFYAESFKLKITKVFKTFVTFVVEKRNCLDSFTSHLLRSE